MKRYGGYGAKLYTHAMPRTGASGKQRHAAGRAPLHNGREALRLDILMIAQGCYCFLEEAYLCIILLGPNQKHR